MSVSNIIKNRRNEILAIATRYGASNIRVFGSMAHGNESPESDIDIIVKMEKGRSLLDIIAIKQDIEELLGRKVDVVTEASISPYIRDNVLKEAVSL
ncbi:MAG: nucleotidyltransferase family protein [Nitrospirota bacterium]|nr:nucleotidyltransferase family protein [Nitrospirota bacterium]